SEMRRLLANELKRLHILEPLRAIRARIRGLGAKVRLLAVDNTSKATQDEPLLRQYRGPSRLYYEKEETETLGMPPLQAALFTWFHGCMLPTLLRNFDRASMAHGIETRMPFMDWRLVAYGFALPDTAKIGGGFTKRILRMAMEGLIPNSIR